MARKQILFIIRSRMAAVSVCLLLCVSALTVRTIRYDVLNNIIGFGCVEQICFAELNRHLLPEDAFVFPTGGYDGQFYFYMAAGIGTGQDFTIDSEPFRFARPLFPLLLSSVAPFGPDSILYAGVILLILTQVIAIHLVHKENPYLGWILSVNPIQLLSFFLFLADGLAASFSLYSFIFFVKYKESADEQKRGMSAIVVLLLFSAALFSKESSIWIGAGMGMYSLLFFRNKDRILFSFVFLSSAVVFLLYWYSIGMFEQVTQKATFPFSGLVHYINEADSLVSGRSLLVGYLVFFIVILLLKIYYMYIKFKENIQIHPADVVSIAMLAGTLLLVSLATAHEYWANFANIARMFLPGVIGGVIHHYSENLTERSERLNRLLKQTGIAMILYSFMFSVMLIAGERS